MKIACAPRGDQWDIDGSLFANYVSEFDKIDSDVVGTELQIRILYFLGFLGKTLPAAADQNINTTKRFSQLVQNHPFESSTTVNSRERGDKKGTFLG